MKGTRDSDDGAIKCPLTQMRSCEERLGALVIEMLHAKQTISKRTICLKIAARIATETDADLYQRSEVKARPSFK